MHKQLQVLGLLTVPARKLVDTPNGKKWQSVGDRFTDTAGVLSRTDPSYHPTEQEFAAIDHLCDEWDYGWNG